MDHGGCGNTTYGKSGYGKKTLLHLLMVHLQDSGKLGGETALCSGMVSVR